MEIDPYRLPRTCLPRRYDVELRPDLGSATFTGRVRIELDVQHPVTELVLNAAELTIHETLVDGVPTPCSFDPALERMTVTPLSALSTGPAVLDITFAGILNDRLRGFYRSTFRGDAGEEHVIAATQMEATDCRRAFPCWDEPDFKAVFGVTLVVDGDHLAISNGAETSRTVMPDGTQVVRFADSMVMSSYLVAFVVGPLVATAAEDVNGTPTRVVHVAGKEHLTQFARDAAVAGLRFFQEYYGIPYPGDKLDLVALPDFSAGAMENLGCITFRENLLLVDPITSTHIEQQNVIEVLNHELAHMWFGDLVTMRWWNGIWLNEAFATFMGVDATDHYRPEWKRWTTFALDRSAAFEVDSLSTTRPVEFKVDSPRDAEGMFDVLTYQKGGALLRMLQQYLGEDPFREGIRHYLTLHAYGNTETSDLWDALEQVTDEPVRQMMDSWIWQPGFPLITASLENDQLVLRQERFGYSAEAADDPARWMVPLHIREIGPEGDQETTVLLVDDRTVVALADPDSTVVVNAGGHGFVRVTYDVTLMGRLGGKVLAALGAIDRYNLVADAWASVVARRLGAADFLTFARGFADETDLAVWQALITGLNGCDRLVDDASRVRFAATVRALIAPATHRLGWQPRDGEDQLTSQLRALLVQTLAVLGDDIDARRRCRELFDRGQTEGVDPELLTAATSVVAAGGDLGTYERFVDLFRAAATPQEQLRYLYALAEFENEDLVRRTCEFALSSDVRTQSAPFVIGRAIANRRHGATAWRFLREHWTEVNERLPANTISRMVDPVKLLNRDEDGPDVQAFFAEHDVPQGHRLLTQVLERQRVNIALRSSQQDSLASYLQ